MGQLQNWVSQRNRALPISSIYIQWPHLLREQSLQQLEYFLSCLQINQQTKKIDNKIKVKEKQQYLFNFNINASYTI